VVQPVARELGTEGQASRWGSTSKATTITKAGFYSKTIRAALSGISACGSPPILTRVPMPRPFTPPVATPVGTLRAMKQIRFWIKARNPNIEGYQNAGPVVRLIGRTGQLEFRPVKDGNIMNDPPLSESRWLWMPVSISPGG